MKAPVEAPLFQGKPDRVNTPAWLQYYQQIEDSARPVKQLLTLLNGVTNYGGAYESASFIRQADGLIVLSGLVNLPVGYTLNVTPIAMLPAGCRPAACHTFAAESFNAYGRIDIRSDGSIVAMVGAVGRWISLSATFVAEQ